MRRASGRSSDQTNTCGSEGISIASSALKRSTMPCGPISRPTRCDGPCVDSVRRR